MRLRRRHLCDSHATYEPGLAEGAFRSARSSGLLAPVIRAPHRSSTGRPGTTFRAAAEFQTRCNSCPTASYRSPTAPAACARRRSTRSSYPVIQRPHPASSRSAQFQVNTLDSRPPRRYLRVGYRERVRRKLGAHLCAHGGRQCGTHPADRRPEPAVRNRHRQIAARAPLVCLREFRRRLCPRLGGRRPGRPPPSRPIRTQHGTAGVASRRDRPAPRCFSRCPHGGHGRSPSATEAA